MDAGHIETDAALARMERKVGKVYSRATKESQEKLKAFLEKFEKQDAQRKAQLEAGKITEQQYLSWRKGRMATGKRFQEMLNTLSEDYANADRIAMSIVGEYMPEVYAINRNFAAFQVEKDSLFDTSFTLYDRQTVERLVREREILLPKPKIDIPRDKRWNKQHIRDEITQGILQGEAIPDIAKRLRNVTDMDYRAAIRNARTATTGAQNAGRVDSYKRAEDMGIKLHQKWIATLDGRTRHSHRMLDGEKIKVGGVFSNGCRYPGDPQGPPGEVYNCRCTLIGALEGFDFPDVPRNNKLGDMSYEEWKYGHQATEKVSNKHVIAEGKDISGSWVRRPGKFDFAIEDVINAQGFDGTPKIVSKEEFDKAVKAANGGNGFIAQRTYSAPDQETLDAYRDQLYHGKWYIDCSTGGSQYGRGMYCAADYSGALSDGIKAEMKHYQELGTDRLQTESQKAFERNLSIADFNKNSSVKVSADEFNVFKLDRIEGDDLLSDSQKELLGKMLDNGKYSQLTRFFSEESDKFVAEYMRHNGFNYTETLTLDPSAKIITWEEVDKLMNAYNGPLSDFDYDEGVWAALHGYDAINAINHGESGSYTVVLNRTKLIVLGEE